MFPQKTLDLMIKKAKNKLESYIFFDNVGPKKYIELISKLKEIKDLKNIDKMNRWFGYYQKVGEDMVLWTLEEVKKWVRDEKNNNTDKYFGGKTKIEILFGKIGEKKNETKDN